MRYFENPKSAANRFHYTPLTRNTKDPFIKNWPCNGLSANAIVAYGPFPDRHNIGIITGKASGGIVDIDCDGPYTVLAGGIILPVTGMVFGRKSNPASHHIYWVEGSTKTRQIKNPITGRMIVEIRGDKAQTMAPLSIHPETGETVRFEDGKSGEPARVDREILDAAVGQIATVSVLGEFWVEEGRHKLALWFAGLCVFHGIELGICLTVVRVLCAICDDEETDDRIRAVTDTYDDFETGLPIEWRSKLTALLGSTKTIRAIVEWLNGKEVELKLDSKTKDTRTISVTIDTNTDITTAEAYHDWTRDRLIYAEHEERFYENNCDVYDPVTSSSVKASIIEFLKEPIAASQQNDPGKIRASQSSARINSVYELSKALKRKDDRTFNQHSYLLGAQNGVIDLSTRQLVQPEDIVTRRIGTEYHPDAWCPKFKAFLNQVFDGDDEKIRYVQRAVGYTLTGSVEAQVMFFLIGAGANGKSVFLNVLQALMGDYGTSIPAHSIMQQKFGNDKTDDLASLTGKRFAYATEGEAGDKLAVSKIKRMTGGDIMSVKRLYKDYFNMKSEFKLWFASNELPQIAGNDDAIWRRIHVINFPITITPGERDLKLLEKLKAELPGILNWSLEGLRQIGEMGHDFLDPPQSVLHSIAEYRGDNDNVGDFISAACVRDENAMIMAGDLYSRYESFCHNSSIEPLNKITFSKGLNRLGIGIRKRSTGNARTGIRLK